MIQTSERLSTAPKTLGEHFMHMEISRKTLIYFQIVYVLIILWLNDLLELPSSTLYVTDIVTVAALLSCPKGSWSRLRKLGTSALIWVFAVFCIVLFLGDVAHAVKPTLVLWGIRNTFRFFAFGYACASILNREDIDGFFHMFFWFQVLNICISIIQYAMGFDGDHLGGIFGTVTGCNGYTNVFFCILLAYYSLAFVDGRERFWKFVFIASSTLVIAALSELKLFYFEAAAIVIFAVLCRANKPRSFMLLLVTLMVFIIALQIFSVVFPNAYEMLTNFDELMDYSTDNTGAVEGYNISRINAFSDINQFIFHGNLSLNLFGVGFGNAGYSQFSVFTSTFYGVYGYLNYLFFTTQTWFIETGYVGFGLLIIQFVALCIYCGRWAKRLSEESFYFRLVQIVAIMTVLCFWYNQTLRVEAAYLTFLVLSIPFVVVKDSKFGKDGSVHGLERTR
jgi:hypothetical protein